MTPFVYNATVDRVVDGDTVDVNIDLGFDTHLHKQRIRLLGVDAPESRTRDPLEKQFGLLAKAIVEGFCQPGQKVVLKTFIDKDDKFGRILGIIESNGVNVNEYLIENRYAVAYNGQNKDEIANAHLANYTYLTENGKI